MVHVAFVDAIADLDKVGKDSIQGFHCDQRVSPKRSESPAEKCAQSVKCSNLTFYQHCSCTPVHVVFALAAAVTSALVQVLAQYSSTVSNYSTPFIQLFFFLHFVEKSICCFTLCCFIFCCCIFCCFRSCCSCHIGIGSSFGTKFIHGIEPQQSFRPTFFFLHFVVLPFVVFPFVVFPFVVLSFVVLPFVVFALAAVTSALVQVLGQYSSTVSNHNSPFIHLFSFFILLKINLLFYILFYSLLLYPLLFLPLLFSLLLQLSHRHWFKFWHNIHPRYRTTTVHSFTFFLSSFC